MASWRKSHSVLCVEFVLYILATCLIVYMLGRHLLLVHGFVETQELKCGDCSRALCRWLRGLHSDSGAIVVHSAPTTSSAVNEVEAILYYGTVVTLSIFLVYCMSSLFVYFSSFGWLPFDYCRYGIPVGAVTYQSAKCSMYLVLITRLDQGFEKSKWAPSQWKIRVMYCAVALFGFVMCIIFAVFARGKREEASNDVHFCATIVPPTLFAAVTLFDFVFTIVVVKFFVSSLKNALRDFSELTDETTVAKDKEENADLYLLPLKYTLLSTLAVISTMVSVLLLVATGTLLSPPIDIVINCASLVLMTNHWSPVYDMICTPVVRCLANTPGFDCCAEEKEVLEMMRLEKQRVQNGAEQIEV